MTRDSYFGVTPNLEKAFKSKKIVVQSFVRSEWTQNKKNQSVRIIKNKSLDKVVKNSFSKKFGYHNAIFKELELDEYAIKGESGLNAPKTLNLLRESSYHKEVDYYVDIYDYIEMKGHGHSYMPIWGIIHVFTLGLIPVWIPVKIEMRMDIYDSKGKFLTQKIITNKASKWMWSPNIFRDDARKASSDEFNETIYENTLDGLIDNLNLELY